MMRERQTERDGREVNIRDLIKQTRKNKVFDYKSLIYETELKVFTNIYRLNLSLLPFAFNPKRVGWGWERGKVLSPIAGPSSP